MNKNEIIENCYTYDGHEKSNYYKKLDKVLKSFYSNIDGIYKNDSRVWNIPDNLLNEIVWNYNNYNTPFSKALRNAFKYPVTIKRWEKIIKEQFEVESLAEFYFNEYDDDEIEYALSTISRVKNLPDFMYSNI